MTPSEPPNPAGSAFDQSGQTVHGGQTNIYNVYPESVPASPSSQQQRCDFYQHVRLPANYVPRPALLAEIKATLFQAQQDIALTSSELQADALFGMGGIGKTVMARALCEDAEVHEAFPDGILWATLGQTPDLPARLREWVRILGGTIPQTAPTLEELTNSLAQSVAGRHCLLIVDDVWEQAHLERFMVHGAGCCLLFTTRNAAIATELNATIRPVPVMALREAIALLVEWAGPTAANITQPQQVAIVERLGRLPLAIKLAGDQLRRRDPEKWLTTFDARGLRKRQIETIHDSLENTFTLSLTDLTDIERQLYISLSIFKEDEAVLFPAVAKLWAELANYSADDTVDLLHFLNDRALLELSGMPGISVGANRDETLRATFHDLIRDLMRAELEPEGRHAGHVALLAAYRRSRKTAGWSSAPHDGYLYDHLVYHLSEVAPHNRIARQELLDLFANAKWLQVRVPTAGYRYDGYIADLEQAWALYHQESHPEAKAIGSLTAFPVHLRFALLRTSINSLVINYGPALVGYAVQMDLWPIERALSIFAQTPDPLHKAQLGCALLETGKLTAIDQTRVLQQSLHFATFVTPTEARLRIQLALYPFLPEAERDPMLRHFLAVIPNLPSEWLQVKALALLFPLLAPVHHDAALNLVAELKDLRLQAEAAMTFMLLADKLSSATEQALAALIAKAKDIADFAAILYSMSCQWRTVTDRSDPVLKAMFEVSTSSQVDNFLQKLAALFRHTQKAPMFVQALSTVLAISKEKRQAEVLITLAPHLSGELKMQAFAQPLSAALTISDEAKRAAALTRLAPHLGEERMLAQALSAALAISDEEWRTEVLTTLAPHLRGELKTQALVQALSAALAISEERRRAEALITLAPHLGEERMLAQVLSAALVISNEGWRTEVLTTLVPHLSEERMLAQALSAALAISGEGRRVAVLTTLAPHLRGELKTQALVQALSAALDISDEGWRAKVLTRLAMHLSEERMLAQVLSAALAISEESRQAEVLIALAPHLRGELKTQALVQALWTALAISNEAKRVEVLTTLSPHMSEEQMLTQTLAILEEGQRIQAIQKLTPVLSELSRSKALLYAIKVTPIITDARLRNDSLLWLVPYIPEISAAVYTEVLQALQDEWVRADLIELLMPYASLATHTAIAQLLPTFSDPINRHTAVQLLSASSADATIEQQLQASTIEQALQASIAIKDNPNRIKLYTILAEQLHTEMKELVNDRKRQALDELDSPTDLTTMQLHLAYCQKSEQRTQLRARAIEFPLVISNSTERAKVLLDLLVYLEPDEQLPVVEQLLNTVRTIQEIKELAQTIHQIMKNVHFTAKQEVATMALGYVMNTREMANSESYYTLSIDNFNVRVELLCDAIPFLESIFQQVAIRQVLNEGQYIDGAEPHAYALTALLPYVRGAEHIKIFHRVLLIAHAVDDELTRFAILVKAASADINRQAFSEAKIIATTLDNPKARAEAIVALLPLAEPLEKHFLLRKGLAAALQLTKQSERAATLAHYLPYVKNPQPIIEELCFAAIQNMRVQAPTAKRADLLDYLANEPLFRSAYLPEEFVLTIAQTISEICNDWAWL